MRGRIARVFQAGAVYFALVFAAGVGLGVARVVWLVPRLGGTAAELLEMPVMLAVTVLAARWTVRWFGVPPVRGRRLAVGLVALGLLLLAELTIVLRLRDLTLGEYVASRDPVSGTVYLVMLAVFALMPAAVARR
jgi:hypothetical protein